MAPPNAGIYQILLWLHEPLTLVVGRLGEVRLEAGYWVYTGSAARGLAARVARHQATNKPLHWHIDHLTSRVGVVAVRLLPLAAGECQVAQATAALPGASQPVPGFGSSDCRAGCRAHLTWLGPSADAWRTQATDPPHAG